MYPGFSGGPLLDTDGNVLGMITSGLGFGGPAVALPWSLVTQVAETLKTHGKVARGYLGIGSQPVTLSQQAKDLAGGQERGLLVIQVAEGGPGGDGRCAAGRYSRQTGWKRHQQCRRPAGTAQSESGGHQRDRFGGARG